MFVSMVKTMKEIMFYKTNIIVKISRLGVIFDKI